MITHTENRGLIGALNHGLESIASRYVFRHDADDRAHPERLKKCLRYFAEKPDTVLLGSAIIRVDESGRRLGLQHFPETDAEIRWQLLFRNPFAHSAVAFSRAKVAALGGYSVDAPFAEDYDLWVRLAGVGRLANLPDTLCEYRVHGESITATNLERMATQSAKISARWFGNLGKKIGGESPGAVRWEKFRKRETLTAEELRAMVSELEFVKSQADLSEYPSGKANADLTWHILTYFKERRGLAVDPRNFPLLLRSLHLLLDWPASRWRSS